MPISLFNFFAKWFNSNIVLYWATLTEINNSYFNIQSSLDGCLFETIGVVGTKGSTGNTSKYEFIDSCTDKANIETVYYRLQQVDVDGSFSFSTVTAIKLNNTNAITIYPNPASNFITLQGVHKKINYNITNILGKMVQNETLEYDFIDVSNLDKGLYHLNFERNHIEFIKN